MSLPDASKPVYPARPLPRGPEPADPGPPAAAPAADAPAYRPPAVLTAPPSVGGLLRALARRWPLALGAGLVLGGLAAAGLWLAVPAKYVAEAGVIVRRPPREFNQSYEQVPEFANYQRTQAAMLKSPLVLEAALKQPQVAELPGVRAQKDTAAGVAWLEKMLTVTFKSGSEVVGVAATGDDPEELAILVNAVVKAYVQEHVSQRQAYLQRLKDSYAKGEASLKFKRKGLMDVEDPSVALLERDWQQARADLSKAVAEEALLKKREKELENLPATEAAIDEYLRRDEIYLAQQKELIRVEENIAITKERARGTAGVRLVNRLENEKGEILLRMAERRRALLPFVERQVRDKAISDNRAALKAVELRIAAAAEHEKTLAEEYKKKSVGRGPESPEVRALRDDVAAKLEVQNKLGQEIQVVEMEGQQPTWVVPLGEAKPPQERDLSLRLKAAGLGGGGLFALAVLGVAWLEFRARRVTAPADLSQGLGLRLVGTVPALPARARRAAVTGSSSPRDQAWQSRLTEAVDALRTLLLRAAGDGPRVVLITSAVDGEGKTSLAGQLAVSLARAWRKTLLIDGDVRKPAAHQLFNLSVEPGLCEVLRGEMEPNDVVQSTAVSRLWLMPSGHWDAHAIQALAQEGSGALFDQLKDQYDFVVVDSSPVLPVADTLVLGQHVDAVLLAVRAGVSRLPAVHAAHHRLHTLGIPVLGGVLIGANGDLTGLEVSYPRATARGSVK